MRKACAYVLLAAAMIALLLLWLVDAARGPELDLSDERRMASKPASLTAEAAPPPGLEPLSDEKRARLKQKSAPRPPVIVRVTCRGKPVVGRSVRLSGMRLDEGKSLKHEGPTDERGELRYGLPRGLYRVGLVPPPLDPLARARLAEAFPNYNPGEPPGLEYAQDLLTHRGPLAEPLHIELPPGALRVRVQTPAGLALAGAHVSVGRKTAQTDSQGKARIDELDPGETTLSAWKEGYRMIRPRGQRCIEIAADRDTEGEVTLGRGGFLVLRSLDTSGRAVRAPRESRVELVDVARGASVPFDVVLLPGRYRLALEAERIQRGKRFPVHFQPLDPVPAQEFEIAAGRTTTLEWTVRPRASVSLRVLDADGSVQWRRVRVRVYTRVTASRPRMRCVTRSAYDPWYATPRFEGHLPPGTYDVEITRDGAVEHHELVVGREPVSVGYKPR